MAGDDDYEIPESGAVFTFGRSRFAENLSSHFFIRNDPVMEISCGDEHTALVCGSGRVFLFGNNDYGQLGFGHTKVMNKPSCLKYLKPFHSTHVACGKGHTIISTACSRIFTFGYNSDGQLGIGDLNDRVVPQMITTGLSDEDNIVAVAAGCHHSAFLTESGDVYLWGSNSDGQCGVEEISYIPTPQKLQFDEPVSSISCGYYHTAFISLGKIYTFGEEDNGKLGRTKKLSKNEPEKVELPENCALVKCGGSHTMVLTDTGAVYAFGSNFSGQLGIGNSEAERSVPTRVKFPDENTQVVHMSCGESHSAFVTDKGGLLTCGDSRHGKLCNEDESTNIPSPTSIPMFENYFCTFVSCGGCHTMVLAKIRPRESDPVISVSQTKNVLPPLKTDTSHLELTNFVGDEEIEEKTEKGEQQNGDDNEECDTKSNTESNINNEEAVSHLDEIYTEIEEIVSGKPEADSKPPDESPVTQIKETNEHDLVVATPETAIKKLFSVFKRKKSASAVLLSNKSEEKGLPNSSSQNAANPQKSRTCVVL